MKRLFKYLIISILAFGWSCSCDKNKPVDPTPDPEPISGEVATLYTTAADGSKVFVKSTSELVDASSASGNVVKITDEKFQTIDGFGAAMTWASCYNLLTMSAENRESFLRELFDVENGLGISLVRVSMGASDFNYEEYTWCDQPGMENFEVDPRDKDVVFPVLKEMYKINPKVRIIASPWSCPIWMKRRSVNDDSDFLSWTSGSLKPSCYQDYAEYFVRWIKAMENEGFNIYAVTVQNEPLNHGNSMSMYMTWQEQRDFIKTALGPAFEKAGLKTKILVFDHNYNYDNASGQKNYPLNIYKDPDASKYVAGSAWHNYGGNVSELDNIVANAPDKDIYFTEASIGTWNYNFSSCLINDFRDIFMGTLSRGGKGVTLWNMVLDENKGPYSPKDGSCKTCYGAVTLMTSTRTIGQRMTHYYNIAHASKVIRQDAVRVGTTGYSKSGISYQVFKNPDGTYGAIVLNETGDSQPISFAGSRKSVKCTLPARSIVSVIWKE